MYLFLLEYIKANSHTSPVILQYTFIADKDVFHNPTPITKSNKNSFISPNNHFWGSASPVRSQDTLV